MHAHGHAHTYALLLPFFHGVKNNLKPCLPTSPPLPTKDTNHTQQSPSEHAQLPDGWECTGPVAPLLTSAAAPQETPGDIISLKTLQSTASRLLGSSCTNSAFKGSRGALKSSALAGKGVRGMKHNAKKQHKLHPMLGFLAANRVGIAWVHLEGGDSCCKTISPCIYHVRHLELGKQHRRELKDRGVLERVPALGAHAANAKRGNTTFLFCFRVEPEGPSAPASHMCSRHSWSILVYCS